MNVNVQDVADREIINGDEVVMLREKPIGKLFVLYVVSDQDAK